VSIYSSVESAAKTLHILGLEYVTSLVSRLSRSRDTWPVT